MQYALPNPRQAIAIPLVTLVVGAAGGATMAALIIDEEPVLVPSANVASQGPALSQARPVEGAAALSMNLGAQASGLSEKSTDPSLTWPSAPPGPAEKSTDHSITR